MRWCRTSVVVTGLLAAFVVSPTPAAETEADYPCFGEVDPLRYEKAPSFGVLSLFVPPLLFLEAAARDDLSDRPRRKMRLSVKGPKATGGPFRLAVAHEGKRYLGDLADGASIALPEGRHVVVAARVESDGSVAWGRREITVSAKGPSRLEVTIDRRTAIGGPLRVTQTAPDGRAPAGSVVRVDWTGPWQSEARIGFTEAGAEGLVAPAMRVGADRPAEVEVPARPGPHRMRLELCAPRLPLAELPIEVAPADVRLDAPATVVAGEAFQVHSLGRNGLDFTIALLAPDGHEVDRREPSLAEPEAEFTAPLEPGRYTLVRRTSGTDETATELARRTIEVTPAAVAITAPERIRTGQRIGLDWTGSAGATRMELWSLDADGARARRLRRRVSPGDAVRLPVGPGLWELRLVSTSGSETVLARRRIAVEGAFFTQAPVELKPREHWAVGFAEEPAFFDELAFVPRGAGIEAIDDWKTIRASGSRAVDIVAPERPGAYDLLIVSSEPTEEPVVLDRRPIEVK